ncbi:MAG: hypothetical protein WAN50_01715 [Minisyncoccia bacterium]
MPQMENNEPPPETMTWGKAAPVLALSVIFDALRFVFDMFWLFAPLIASGIAAVVASGVVNQWVGWAPGAIKDGIVSATVTIAGLGTVAGTEVIAPFGVFMAMATGLCGWLTIGAILVVTNRRIFAENTETVLEYGSTLAGSELPILNALPMLTVVTTRMYRKQIRLEKAALKKYEQGLAQARMFQHNARDAKVTEILRHREAKARAQEESGEDGESGRNQSRSATGTFPGDSAIPQAVRPPSAASTVTSLEDFKANRQSARQMPRGSVIPRAPGTVASLDDHRANRQPPGTIPETDKIPA